MLNIQELYALLKSYLKLIYLREASNTIAEADLNTNNYRIQIEMSSKVRKYKKR